MLLVLSGNVSEDNLEETLAALKKRGEGAPERTVPSLESLNLNRLLWKKNQG
jgi:hypothetical protein